MGLNEDSGKQYESITRQLLHLFCFHPNLSGQSWAVAQTYSGKEKKKKFTFSFKFEFFLNCTSLVKSQWCRVIQIIQRKMQRVCIRVSVECIHRSCSYHRLFTHGGRLHRLPASASGPASWQSSPAFVSTVWHRTSTCMTGKQQSHSKQEQSTFIETAEILCIGSFPYLSV